MRDQLVRVAKERWKTVICHSNGDLKKVADSFGMNLSQAWHQVKKLELEEDLVQAKMQPSIRELRAL